MITLNEIAAHRLRNQQLVSPDFCTVKELVAYMGAMQAQDALMLKWAIGLRVQATTNQLVEQALADGDILRTHLMRPTWHCVTPEDIHWLLKLTAPQILSICKTRDKNLELTEQIYSRSNAIIEKVLADNGHLTRDEILPALHAAGIDTDENRASHLFMRAELERIICSGKPKAHKQTYALLSERAPDLLNLHHDEAVMKLAKRYFSSHGPATLQDFAWWSGLSFRDVRSTQDMLQSAFVKESLDAKDYWFSPDMSPITHTDRVLALPAYDEFLISYRDRTASLSSERNARAVSSNGIFRPVILVDGQVAGVWKRTAKGKQVLIEAEYFETLSPALKQKTDEALDQYRRFIS